jgi:hypothetical protein
VGASVVYGLGTYLALQRAGLLKPRARVISGLVAVGITSIIITTETILKNPIGFNLLI